MTGPSNGAPLGLVDRNRSLQLSIAGLMGRFFIGGPAAAIGAQIGLRTAKWPVETAGDIGGFEALKSRVSVLNPKGGIANGAEPRHSLARFKGDPKVGLSEGVNGA